MLLKKSPEDDSNGADDGGFNEIVHPSPVLFDPCAPGNNTRTNCMKREQKILMMKYLYIYINHKINKQLRYVFFLSCISSIMHQYNAAPAILACILQ